jgi:acyl-CoA synthetase (AMP-forming)/AMP-acid ligase II
MAIHRLGGTVIVMEKFDAEAALRTIDRFGVTVSQWVPTMFVRMLKLPAEAKDSFNLSSQRVAIHAAAPCPINVKQQMIEWWGPVLHEYYAGTEGIGFVYVNSHDWLRHPGTVGKPLVGILHICNEAGEEVANGEEGVIYFESASRFRYHNDPKKTAESRHPQHPSWATLGDVGKLDAEGFLYLTDRKAFMIISGGVNIYPQEAENLLITHPKVADAAVVGVPNDDLGEEVKAVIQPMNWADATPELASELIDYCRARLANIKCPRSIDFEQDLPRQPTGKLYKRLIRDRYWHQRTSRIV